MNSQELNYWNFRIGLMLAKTTCMRLVILALLVLISPTANGQQRREPNASANVEIRSPKLPARYTGIDPQSVYEALEKREKDRQKDEFETTLAFQSRLKELESRKLLGSFGIGDLFAVPLATTSIYDRLKSSYDADAEELRVEIECGAPTIGVTTELSQRWAASKYDFLPTSTYTGVNGFGARVTVEKNTTYIYGVIFNNISSYALPPEPYSYSSTIATRLKVSPPAAKAAKDNLRALFFVRLQEPFLQKGFIKIEPTIAKPKEIFAAYHYLVVSVEQIWIYNFETGEIYKKIIPRDP